MSIWQRLSTAGRDFSAKGQISSLLGFRPAGAQKSKQVAEPDNEMPFTVGVIVLSAKMAKADGIVAADEVKAFKEAFKVSAAEMREAAHVFNSAKRDAANFEDTAEQLAAVFNGDRKLLEDVLDGLFHIAKADEDVHRQEEEFLGEVARRFGFTAGEFNAIKARHVVAAAADDHPHLPRQHQWRSRGRQFGLLASERDSFARRERRVAAGGRAACRRRRCHHRHGANRLAGAADAAAADKYRAGRG